MVNINETIQKIKAVGPKAVRCVPMGGQSIMDGDFQIEIMEGTNWTPILTGIKRRMAEDLITQATNKVILG